MVMGVASPVAARFSITQTFADSFHALRRNFLLFVISAFLFRLIWLLAPLFDGAGRIIGEATWTNMVAKPVIGIVSPGFIEAAVAFGTALSLQGRGASLADAGRGLRFVVPVTVASVIYCVPGIAASLGPDLVEHFWLGDQSSAGAHIVAGLMALVFSIAVVIIGLAWFVYAPAIIFEQTGAIEGLARSARLTKGQRWRIFGISFLLILIYAAVLFPISRIADVRIAELLSPTRPSISAAIAYLVMSVFHALSAVMIVVVYCSLRAEKERIAAASLAP